MISMEYWTDQEYLTDKEYLLQSKGVSFAQTRPGPGQMVRFRVEVQG